MNKGKIYKKEWKNIGGLPKNKSRKEKALDMGKKNVDYNKIL